MTTAPTKTKHLIDVDEIRRAYSLLVQPGQVVEVRALKASLRNDRPYYKQTVGGFFDNVDDLIKALQRIQSALGQYITIQELDPNLLHRAKNKIIPLEKDYSTPDKNVKRYRWLPLDCDIVREVKLISSNSTEHEQALAHAQKVKQFLVKRGWPAPIEADSGNGAHLLLSVDLPATEESRDLMQRVLKGIARQTDSDTIKLDPSVYNQARIWKLYGTLVCKGDDTEERPHRIAHILHVPDPVQTITHEQLEQIAIPKEVPTEQPQLSNRTGNKKDITLEEWLRDHRVAFTTETRSDQIYYILNDGCVFNPEHQAPEAAVFQRPDGKWCYKCFHDSCGEKHWRDFRLVFEPDAYTRNLTPARNTKEGQPDVESVTQSTRDPWQETPSPPPLNGQVRVANPQRRFNLTDLGNAERFALKYKDSVRWCETWNTWMIFNGKCWESDRTGRVDQFAKIVVRNIYNEAAAEPDEATRKQIAKHATVSESNRSVRAMLDRAKSELPVTPEEFNVHLYLLNCENGTLDLQNGTLHPHTPSDMLTRCLKIKYNPLATCQRWQSFIESIFASDISLITFMQQALGMSLCGDISEQCLFICHGTGSNGKTTMLETVRIIMGQYALAANIETFQMKKNEGTKYDVAELYGARFVTASENALGSRLNEAFIKKATGKEPLRAARKYENEFEFMPEFTIWFAVNHKPVVKDTSKGMWRRVHFIPFNVTIEGNKLDKHLGEKLLEESEGILAWLVQGCIQWCQQGHLEPPSAVKDATQAYRTEMDVVAHFLDDLCINQINVEVGATKLYQAYKQWCIENGERYEKQTAFGLQLKEKGYKKEKTRNGYIYRGIGLIDPDSVNSVNGCEQFSNNRHAREKTAQESLENCSQPFTLFTTEKQQGSGAEVLPGETDVSKKVNPPVTDVETGHAQPFTTVHTVHNQVVKELDTYRLRIEEHIAYKKRYAQRVPQNLHWNAPQLGYEKGLLEFDVYLARIDELRASDNPVIIQAAIEAMRWTLGEQSERRV